MFEEKGGKIIIDYILVGGPAFNGKQLDKGDVITAIDGKVHKGDAIYKAPQVCVILISALLLLLYPHIFVSRWLCSASRSV